MATSKDNRSNNPNIPSVVNAAATAGSEAAAAASTASTWLRYSTAATLAADVTPLEFTHNHPTATSSKDGSEARTDSTAPPPPPPPPPAPASAAAPNGGHAAKACVSCSTNCCCAVDNDPWAPRCKVVATNDRCNAQAAWRALRLRCAPNGNSRCNGNAGRRWRCRYRPRFPADATADAVTAVDSVEAPAPAPAAARAPVPLPTGTAAAPPAPPARPLARAAIHAGWYAPVTTMVWWNPAATDNTGRSGPNPGTSNGDGLSSLLPTPNWPHRLRPMVTRRPSASRATVKYVPQLTSTTAGAGLPGAGAGRGTHVGVKTWRWLPKPSWPASLRPYATIRPSVVTKTVW